LALLNSVPNTRSRLALSPQLLSRDFIGLRISSTETEFLPTLIYLDYCSLVYRHMFELERLMDRKDEVDEDSQGSRKRRREMVCPKLNTADYN
jgi:hypothetical protein